MITLYAGPESELKWEIEGDDVWFLDFGFNEQPFSPYDSAFYASCLLAAEELSKRYKERAPTLFLYRGPLKLNMRHSEELEERFAEFTPADYALFCMQIFSDFLHRISAVFPDEWQLVVEFDVSDEENQAKIAQLLCKRRFEHMRVDIIGAKKALFDPSPQAIVLPLDHHIDLDQINRLMTHGEFKIIPEEKLNEEWDGVDCLYVLRGSLSAWGERMLRGFEAAGGSIKEIGAEGFEPPTHCSQSSCASQTALCSDFD